jgi:hypothetical protein
MTNQQQLDDEDDDAANHRKHPLGVVLRPIFLSAALYTSIEVILQRTLPTWSADTRGRIRSLVHAVIVVVPSARHLFAVRLDSRNEPPALPDADRRLSPVEFACANTTGFFIDDLVHMIYSGDAFKGQGRLYFVHHVVGICLTLVALLARPRANDTIQAMWGMTELSTLFLNANHILDDLSPQRWSGARAFRALKLLNALCFVAAFFTVRVVGMPWLLFKSPDMKRVRESFPLFHPVMGSMWALQLFWFKQVLSIIQKKINQM